MTSGHALAALRCRAGLTKSALAQRVGTTVHRITALEHDREGWDPTLGTRLLCTLTDTYDVAVVTLATVQHMAASGVVVQGEPVLQ